MSHIIQIIRRWLLRLYLTSFFFNCTRSLTPVNEMSPLARPTVPIAACTVIRKVRHSHMQKERKRLGLTVGYATEGDKRIGALREKGNKYAFKEWEYDATTGKPTKAVYQNTKTGNLKRISRLADDVIACNKCGDKSNKQKKCSRCLSVYYCSAECQRSSWSTHKSTCMPQVT